MKRFYRPISWGLFLTLAFLASAGEFLHFLPGCSHYVRQPDGSLVVMGWAVSGDPLAEKDGLFLNSAQGQVVRRGHDQELLILDAGECAICAFTALEKQTSQCVSITIDSCPICLVAISHEGVSVSFSSQAPPVRGPPSLA